MTDDLQAARAETDRLIALASDGVDRLNAENQRLAAALRERDRQLEAAQAVTRRLLGRFGLDRTNWRWHDPWITGLGEPVTDAERAWLDAACLTSTLALDVAGAGTDDHDD